MESDIQKRNPFWQSLLFTFSLISVLWIVKIYELLTHTSFVAYGILPKYIPGLRGVIFSPFIHGDLGHLFSNTVPCFILMIVLFNTYDRVALYIIGVIHILSGLMVWLFAPYGGSHIGISGIIYGIAGFLIGSGLFRKDRRSVSIAIVVTLLYGSMVGGFIPQEGVSWQGHLYGAVVGIVIAFFLRNIKLDDDDHRFTEPEEKEKHFFE